MIMRARSTRPVASLREREISTSARRWSESIESVMTRRAATIASPCDASPLLTISRVLCIRSYNISIIWNLCTSQPRRRSASVASVFFSTQRVPCSLEPPWKFPLGSPSMMFSRHPGRSHRRTRPEISSQQTDRLGPVKDDRRSLCRVHVHTRVLLVAGNQQRGHKEVLRPWLSGGTQVSNPAPSSLARSLQPEGFSRAVDSGPHMRRL
jgi:hypothetical protein